LFEFLLVDVASFFAVVAWFFASFAVDGVTAVGAVFDEALCAYCFVGSSFSAGETSPDADECWQGEAVVEALLFDGAGGAYLFCFGEVSASIWEPPVCRFVSAGCVCGPRLPLKDEVVDRVAVVRLHARLLSGLRCCEIRGRHDTVFL
jgi:hypothetical protein